MPGSLTERRALVDYHPKLSISDQCKLLEISRSSFYYQPLPESQENLNLMRIMDEIYLKDPSRGSRRMEEALERRGLVVNRKRVRRLMGLMGLKAIYPTPKTTVPNPGHRKYPYLLRGLEITRNNQVWCSDITYIPLAKGFLYLNAIMDWKSRYVLSWRLSNTLDIDPCLEALDEALTLGTPEIFNTDQGSQYTSPQFTERLLSRGVQVSMNGRGRALDNVMVERFWRTVKYEHVYIHMHENGDECYEGLQNFISYYNLERGHSSLGYKTPHDVWLAK